ncbi:hypothetical protein Tco_0853213, partial [Tanacetum coccineum]
SLEPGSHKENPEHVVVDDDDDDDDEKKVDEMKDAEMGSLETRTEEMHTVGKYKSVGQSTAKLKVKVLPA